jgi:hypothetical protein
MHFTTIATTLINCAVVSIEVPFFLFAHLFFPLFITDHGDQAPRSSASAAPEWLLSRPQRQTALRPQR